MRVICFTVVSYILQVQVLSHHSNLHYNHLFISRDTNLILLIYKTLGLVMFEGMYLFLFVTNRLQNNWIEWMDWPLILTFCRMAI